MRESVVPSGDCSQCVSLCCRRCCFALVYVSFIEELMCDLSAKVARWVFKLIRRSLSPVGTNGGCGMVTSNSCSLAMGWFVYFIISAGPLVGASGINPVNSMMVLYATFVRLVDVSSGRSVIVSVFVIVMCSAVLDVRRHPNVCSQYLLNVVRHMHFLVWLIMAMFLGFTSW